MNTTVPTQGGANRQKHWAALSVRPTVAVCLLVATGGCALFPRQDDTVVPSGPALSRPGFRTLSESNPYRSPVTVPAEVLTNLTLEACVSLTLQHHRALKRTESELERARLGRRVAQATIFSPRLSASYTAPDDTASARISAGYDSRLGVAVEPFLEFDYDADDEDSHTTEAGIRFSRRLFGTAEHVRLRMARIKAEQAFLTAANRLARTTRELRYDVARAFFGLQRATVRLQVQSLRAADAKAFLQAAEERVRHGLAARVDVVNARINLNQAELDQIEEQTRVTNAREALLVLLALDIDCMLRIVPQDVAGLPPFDRTLEDDIDYVLERHENLVNQRLAIDLTDKEVRVQRDLLKPQLTLGVTSRTKWEGEEFFAETTDDENITVDFSYETALDGKKRDRAKLAQLERQLYEKLSALKDSEDQLETRLRALHRKIRELEVRIELAGERLDAEQNKLTATLKRYEAGDVDNLEVTRAKQDVVNAEIRLRDAQIDLYLRRAEYESLLPAAPGRE